MTTLLGVSPPWPLQVPDTEPRVCETLAQTRGKGDPGWGAGVGGIKQTSIKVDVTSSARLQLSDEAADQSAKKPIHLFSSEAVNRWLKMWFSLEGFFSSLFFF